MPPCTRTYSCVDPLPLTITLPEATDHPHAAGLPSAPPPTKPDSVHAYAVTTGVAIYPNELLDL